MSAVTSSASLNLSNDDWKKVTQALDESWDNLIQPAIDKALSKKPDPVGLAEKVSASVQGRLYKDPAVSKYRARKERLKVKTSACDNLENLSRLLSNRLKAVCKIWEKRRNAAASAWDQRGDLVKPDLKRDRLNDASLEESELTIDALVKDQCQAVAAAHKSSNETLTALEDSFKLVEAWGKPKIGINADLEKAKDQILEDVRRVRNYVFYFVPKTIGMIPFNSVLLARDYIFDDVQKARGDAKYCGEDPKFGDDAVADFRQFYDKAAATLQKTHHKASAIFQQFYDEASSALQKIQDKVTATLELARKVAITGKKISESITACEKFSDEVLAAKKVHFSTLEAFKKSQDETSAAFNKVRDISISLYKAVKGARATAMKSPNEPTIEATIMATFNKIGAQAIAAKKFRDELYATLKNDDEALASLLEAQDESITLTHKLELKGEILAYFLLQEQREALLNKVEDEAIKAVTLHP